MAEKQKTFFQYKEKPLVRSGNTIYYGDMNDDFVVMMQIQSTRPLKDMTAADKIMVSMIATDPATPPQDVIVKTAQKNGLYNALDIASIWLERILKEGQ